MTKVEIIDQMMELSERDRKDAVDKVFGWDWDFDTCKKFTAAWITRYVKELDDNDDNEYAKQWKLWLCEHKTYKLVRQMWKNELDQEGLREEWKDYGSDESLLDWYREYHLDDKEDFKKLVAELQFEESRGDK